MSKQHADIVAFDKAFPPIKIGGQELKFIDGLMYALKDFGPMRVVDISNAIVPPKTLSTGDIVRPDYGPAIKDTVQAYIDKYNAELVKQGLKEEGKAEGSLKILDDFLIAKNQQSAALREYIRNPRIPAHHYLSESLYDRVLANIKPNGIPAGVTGKVPENADPNLSLPLYRAYDKRAMSVFSFTQNPNALALTAIKDSPIVQSLTLGQARDFLQDRSDPKAKGWSEAWATMLAEDYLAAKLRENGGRQLRVPSAKKPDRQADRSDEFKKGSFAFDPINLDTAIAERFGADKMALKGIKPAGDDVEPTYVTTGLQQRKQETERAA